MTRTNDKQKLLSKKEVYAFFSRFFYSWKKQHLSEFWSQNPLFRPFYTAISRDRFIFIHSKVRFDDSKIRPQRIEQSDRRNEAIREIFDEFIEACIARTTGLYYSSNGIITVDERLATYRGRCPFRVYMNSKSGNCG